MLPVRLRFAGRLFVATVVSLALGTLAHAADKAQGKSDPRPAAKSDKPKDRAESLRTIFSHLGLGKGSAVADIGAGGGQDTWVFANLVGETGTVFSQEVVEGSVQSLKKEAKKKELSQVRAVLGRSDDPLLPAASVDMAYLHYVYHHFAKPRDMVRGIWRSLKPGGYLVVIDRERGTLRDWVPENVRAEKHHWTAETTVVRQAREEGFAFVECAEDYWHGKDEFVLLFRRPEAVKEPGRDPDPFLPLSVEQSRRLFLPIGRPYQRPVFVALGQSRKLIPPILKASSGPGLEIVLEEWATQKDERPPLPSQVSMPSVLTDKGDPHLGAEPVNVVFFLDSYHLLFHGETLLSKLREKLSPAGCVYVLDRESKQPLSRREASHRRRIAKKRPSRKWPKQASLCGSVVPNQPRIAFCSSSARRRQRTCRPKPIPLLAARTFLAARGLAQAELVASAWHEDGGRKGCAFGGERARRGSRSDSCCRAGEGNVATPKKQTRGLLRQEGGNVLIVWFSVH